MSYCKKCGEVLSNGAVFCSKCGAPVLDEETLVKSENNEMDEYEKKLEKLLKKQEKTDEQIELENHNEGKKIVRTGIIIAASVFLGIVLIAVLAITTTISEDRANKAALQSDPYAIMVGYYSSDLEGKMYEEVVDLLKDRGFTNIKTYALNDLINGFINKEFEVESITINGDESFSSKKYYSKDVLIVITYHSFPPKDSE